MTEKKDNYSDNTFLLYGTSGCHLCEDAMQLLEDLHHQLLELAASNHFDLPESRVFIVEPCDIALREDLMELYAERIPVLAFKHGADELNWPFDIHQAYQFIQARLVFNSV